MLEELKSLAIFAEAVEQGSFRAAARQLQLSPSVVSYHVSQLEKRLAVALLYRSTRRLTLTEAGQQLYQHAQAMKASASQGLQAVTLAGAQPQGRLVVTLPAALARSPWMAKLAAFAQRYPSLHLQLRLTDSQLDLIDEGIDLALRATTVLNSSSLKCRRLGEVKRVLVASPSLCSHYGQPQHPLDLQHWPWIRLQMLSNSRRFIGPGQAAAEIEFRPRVEVDSVDALTELCRLGMGLATPPDYLAEPLLRQGALQRLLPQWRVESLPVFALWPANVAAGSPVRLLLAQLTDEE